MSDLSTEPDSPRTSQVAAARPGWPLLVLAAIGGLLAVKSLLGSWLALRLVVAPDINREQRHGIGYFGLTSIGFAVGIVVLAVLVGLALWPAGGRRDRLSLAALGVAGLLTLDLATVFPRLSGVQWDAGREVVRLRDGYEGLPTEVEFHVTSPGLYAGLAATLLFALVAAQLRWQRRGPYVQAMIGATVGAVAAVFLPWTRLWVVIDRESGTILESRTWWLWSGGFEGALMIIELVVLAALVSACLRAPGYARARWAAASAPLAGLLVFSVLVRETGIKEDAFALGEQVSEVLEVSTTGAGPLLAVGAALLGLAAVRAWWHGREEIPEPTSDAGWLPATLRERDQGVATDLG